MKSWQWVLISIWIWPSGLNSQVLTPDDSATARAINQAVAFFQLEPTTFDPDAYLIYHFLARRFDLPNKVSTSQYLAQLETGTHYKEFKPFFRIIGEGEFDRRFLVADSSLNDITIAGIWYDKLRNRRLLEKRIQSMDFGDDYNVTHAFLALLIAQRQFGARPSTALWDRLLSRMLEIGSPTGKPYCDVQIEALAILAFAGRQFDISREARKQLIAIQNPDGTWMHCPESNPNPNQHTTVLALWALLELRGGANEAVGIVWVR